MGSIQRASAPDRILAAAIELFGEQGFEHTTIRQIAARAGVAVGLVNHHYGSKDALHRACDQRVVRFIATEKDLVMSGNASDLRTYIDRNPELAPYVAYTVRALRTGGPVAQHMFDRLVDVTTSMIADGVAAGVMTEQPDVEAAAVLLAAYGVGVMLLGDQVARRLGGDDLLSSEVLDRYGRASTYLFSTPLFRDPRFLDAFAPQEDHHTKDDK